jgi:hypothetical protein
MIIAHNLQDLNKWEHIITPEMYNDELQKLELCITQLEEGTLSHSMYDTKGRRKGLPVSGMGKVNSISFAPLCLFTALTHPNCTETIKFACYAGSNLDHTQTFWNELIQQKVVTGDEPSPSDWKKITTNAGVMKCAQRQADIEQVFCTRNRKNPRADILFYGQDMFIIQHNLVLTKSGDQLNGKNSPILLQIN